MGKPSVLLVTVLCSALIVGLDGSQGRTTERSVRLRFPDRADLTGLSIQYYLVGSSGRLGGLVHTAPDNREYVVETSQQGEQSNSLKAIVYCPGYRLVLLNESDLSSRQSGAISIDLKPLGWVPLSGWLISGPIPRDLNIEATYLAHWGHPFFGIADGAVASFTVATSKVALDGSFLLNIPDFARDPVVTSFQEGPMRGELRLIARESGTQNIPYALEEVQNPERDVNLPVAAEYSRELLLVGVPR